MQKSMRPYCLQVDATSLYAGYQYGQMMTDVRTSSHKPIMEANKGG